MKCILCGKRKPKRYCPANNSSICPVCCGEKRGVEINCPADCEYFVEGLRNQQEKLARKRIRKEGVGTYVRKAELYRKNPGIFALIEKEISRIYRSNTKINDRDLVTALEQLHRTMKTEKSGIYYEHNGENPYANEISTALLRAVRTSMNQNNGSYKDIEFCMEVVEQFLNEARFYIENQSAANSYLVHISRYHPWEGRDSKQDKGIII